MHLMSDITNEENEEGDSDIVICDYTGDPEVEA